MKGHGLKAKLVELDGNHWKIILHLVLVRRWALPLPVGTIQDRFSNERSVRYRDMPDSAHSRIGF